MTALKPYAEYTGPSTDWLGKVPAHWELASLRQVCGIAGGMTPPKSRPDYWIGDVPWVSPKDMKRFRIAGAIDSISHEAVKHTGMTLLPVGSVLVVVRGMILARRVPVAVTESPLTINQDMKALIPAPRLIPDYLARVLSAGQDALFPLIDEAGHGTRRLPTPLLMSVLIPVPPLAEQRAIADFLDVMDARISRFIAAKRLMIALLEEKKQAVINQAVTRGLDPDVPLKDSGVDWLGEIPAHWDTRKVGALTILIQTGPFGSQLPASEYVEGGVPLINPSHITAGRVVPDPAVAVSEPTAERLGRHRFQINDIVLARRGEMGRCAVVTSVEQGWLCGTGSLLVRPMSALVSPQYLQLALSNGSLAAWLVLRSAGATMSNLNTTMVAAISVPVPSMEEQHAIVEHIERDSSRISLAAEPAQREIELIREYRTRLISDVVTGKLDVRGVDLPAVEGAADAGIEEMLDEPEAAFEDALEDVSVDG